MTEAVEYRYAAFEFRAADSGSSPGTLSGVAMPYGSVADLGGGLRERFEPGAFGPDPGRADVMANWQHSRERPLGRTGGGGLTLTDGPDALRAELVLPNTMQGRDVAELASRRVLRGFSIEFRALREGFRGGVRVVSGAVLTGIAIVDKPAYGDALASLRARALDAAGVDQAPGGIEQITAPRRRVWL